MATAIGDLAVKLKLSAEPMIAGIKAAESRLASFGSMASSLAKGLKGGLGAAKSNIESLMDAPLKYVTGIVKQIPYLGDLLALPLEGLGFLWGEFDKGSKRIKELGDAAARAGMPIEQYQVLALAAGDASEAMEKAVFKLNQKLGDAAMGGKEAQEGFKAIGLDAVNLSATTAVDRFKTLAQRVADIRDAGIQAKVAFDLFGKTGYALLPLLSRGAAGIEKAQKLMEGSGGLVSQQDLANIRKAGEIQREIKVFREAVNTQITIGMAPILAAAVEKFGGLGLTAKGVADTVFAALKKAGEIGAYVIDNWNVFGGVIARVADMLGAMGSAMLSLFAKVAGAVEDLIALATGKTADGNAHDDSTWMGWMKNRLGFGEADKTGRGTAADILPSADTLKQQGAAGVKRRLSEVLAEMATSGISGAIDAMGKGEGKAQAAWRQIMEAAAEKRKDGIVGPVDRLMDAFIAATARMKPILEDIKTPMDKFNEQLEGLRAAAWAAAEAGAAGQAMLADGSIYRALAKQYGILDAAYRPAESKAPGAVLAGTKEAYSAALAFQRQGEDAQQDPQKRIEAIIKQQLAEDKRLVELGRRTAEALEKIRPRGI